MFVVPSRSVALGLRLDSCVMCVFKSYLGYHNAYTSNTPNKHLWIECCFYYLVIVVIISHITQLILNGWGYLRGESLKSVLTTC